MDDKTLYFSDKLAMWFAVVPAVVGAFVGIGNVVADGIKDPVIAGAWILAGILLPAVFGLMVFGATTPFLAWWKMMRLAGIGVIGCVGRLCVIFLIMGAIWTFYAGLADTPVLKVLNGLFLFGLPWTIRDVIRVRKLNEVGGVNLPEVRR